MRNANQAAIEKYSRLYSQSTDEINLLREQESHQHFLFSVKYNIIFSDNFGKFST